MRLVIKPDEISSAAYAAAYMKRRIVEFEPTPEKPFVIGLSAGYSVIETYERLVELHKSGEVNFRSH